MPSDSTEDAAHAALAPHSRFSPHYGPVVKLTEAVAAAAERERVVRAELQAEIDKLNRERAESEADWSAYSVSLHQRIDKALARHVEDVEHADGMCTCGLPYPCPTRAALCGDTETREEGKQQPPRDVPVVDKRGRPTSEKVRDGGQPGNAEPEPGRGPTTPAEPLLPTQFARPVSGQGTGEAQR